MISFHVETYLVLTDTHTQTNYCNPRSRMRRGLIMQVSHHCKTCQRPHHTLLHIDSTPATPQPSLAPHDVSSNASSDFSRNPLMMTCMVSVQAPDGSNVKARALLDSASSASFISERLVKGLSLPRLHHNTTISGIAGLTHNCLQSITNVTISSIGP